MQTIFEEEKKKSRLYGDVGFKTGRGFTKKKPGGRGLYMPQQGWKR